MCDGARRLNFLPPLGSAHGRFLLFQAKETSMISYVKQTELPPVVKDDIDRFEQIRKAAAERHLKSDTDGARRRERQKADDNKLL